jgi:DNA-binding MarR family transcriptional regulator
LEADGLILRKPDAEDRRKVRVRLTSTGHKVLHENSGPKAKALAGYHLMVAFARLERLRPFKIRLLERKLNSLAGK